MFFELSSFSISSLFCKIVNIWLLKCQTSKKNFKAESLLWIYCIRHLHTRPLLGYGKTVLKRHYNLRLTFALCITSEAAIIYSSNKTNIIGDPVCTVVQCLTALENEFIICLASLSLEKILLF